jgi:urea transport system permease protein
LAVTAACFLVARAVTHSRIGTVLKSIRDNDLRAEFMGYNVANYRIFVFCVSAFMAAAAGAMYAAWVGIVSFLDAGPVFSVEGVIWTAVGGRATLVGAFVGAFLIKGLEFLLSGILAEFWQILMGALFVIVVLWMPDGIVGTIGDWLRRRGRASMWQIREEEERRALDRQRDWVAAGAAKPGEEVM